MWLNSYFTSSAAAVPVLDSWSYAAAAAICHAQWPWTQARNSAGPSQTVCPLNALPSLPGADTWSTENLQQPVSDLFQSWLALSLARHGRLVTIVHGCITALHGLQINCATLKRFPSAGRTQTWPWARSLFPVKSCSRYSSAWYGTLFLNRTCCVVPRRNWTKLRWLTLPLSDFLLVLCRRILPDRFRAPDTYWKTTLKALGVKPQFSQQFFMGRLTELMMPELCYQFG